VRRRGENPRIFFTRFLPFLSLHRLLGDVPVFEKHSEEKARPFACGL
jgi:hypothetical protein